jgi:hemerythrin
VPLRRIVAGQDDAGKIPWLDEESMGLVWREQLSVGNDVIDSDHKYLIEIINRAGRGLETRNRHELFEALDSLSHYGQEHFAREEMFAHEVGYTQVPHLSESHERLIKQLDQVKREIGEMGHEWPSETADHFSSLLRDWLIDHVIKEDLLMKPFFQKYPPRFDPRLK